LPALRMNGAPVDDEALLAWLETGAPALTLSEHGRTIAVQRMAADQLAARFGYVSAPSPAKAG